MEKQVLQQLEAAEMAKKAEEEKERQEKQELEEKRAAELAQENAAKEAASAAAEMVKETEENGDEQNEEEASANKESSPESETEPSTASISESTNNNNPTMSSVTATLTAMPAAMGATTSISTSSSSCTFTKPPVNINFSEFERESDPFEKAELQTLNTMEQLAEVLQTTTATTNVQPITIPNPPVYSTSNTHNQYTNVAGSYPYYGAGHVATRPQQPNQFYYQPPRPYFPPAFQTGTYDDIVG